MRSSVLRPLESKTLKLETNLQLLEKLTCRAGYINPTRYAALAIFHALHDARRFAALGTIRALARIHHFLTVRRFSDLSTDCHNSPLLVSSRCAQRSAEFPARILWMGMFQKAWETGIHFGRRCVWFLFRSCLFYSKVIRAVLATVDPIPSPLLPSYVCLPRRLKYACHQI